MSTKKRMGRPPVDTELLRTRVDREIIVALDKFRSEEKDEPNRPEAMRRIMRKWLAENGFYSGERR